MSFIILFFACENENTLNEDEFIFNKKKRLEFYGNTQGTTYAIICNDSIQINQNEIDQILSEFDRALSSYIPNSILSTINNASPQSIVYKDSFNYFNNCLQKSREIYNQTKGAFDPTVYPLVDGWGFMKDIENVPDSVTVDSLRSLIGFQNGYHFTFSPAFSNDSMYKDSKVIKNTPNAKLDFNAIAQGYSVDIISEFLEKKGAKNYFVEIGGEIRVKGKNSEGNLWRIGIDKPIENSNAENREIQEIVELNNKSIATSGSYRKFYEKDGIKYSHTLNPFTGYPVEHSLLSVTVVANDCASADGYATAFMVLGPDKTVKFIKENPQLNLEIYMVFYNQKGRTETYMTQGFKDLLSKE